MPAPPALARDWAGGLPAEILDAVLALLPSFADHLRFAAVCAPWRSAAKEARQARRRLPPPAPWVVLRPLVEWGPPQGPSVALAPSGGIEEEPPDADADGYRSFYFLRPSDGKFHVLRPRLRLPSGGDFRWRSIVGISPDGWLMFTNERLELCALNPLTGTLLRLPPANTILPRRVRRVVMSSPCEVSASVTGSGAPHGSAIFAAILVNQWCHQDAVALASAGDPWWTLLDTAGLADVFDVTYHRGRFYILGTLRAKWTSVCVAVVDCGAGDPLSAAKVAVFPLECKGREVELCDLGPGHRLIGSPSGDLLAFDAVKTVAGPPRVSLVDLHPIGEVGGSERLRVVQLRDLGDQALLAGHPCSMLVSTREVPQLKRNCVYNACGSSTNVFNLEDGRKETHTFRDYIMAEWFMPGVF